MLEVIVFVAVTSALTFVSRASLTKPGSHGFYRYFAWECMLGLYVLNIRVWYDHTGSTNQIIATCLFMISLGLLLFSVALLLLSGKPDSKRDDAPMLEFEKTTHLVTTGLYRFIRHPMYASLFFLCWGFFFKQPSVIGIVLAVVASGFLVATARVEEGENIRYFGNEYREYMKRSKMFIPYIL